MGCSPEDLPEAITTTTTTVAYAASNDNDDDNWLIKSVVETNVKKLLLIDLIWLGGGRLFNAKSRFYIDL